MNYYERALNYLFNKKFSSLQIKKKKKKRKIRSRLKKEKRRKKKWRRFYYSPETCWFIIGLNYNF